MPDVSLLEVAELRARRWVDVPWEPGVYWWYFPKADIERFRLSAFCSVNRLRLRRSPDEERVCLYHGIAGSLSERVRWHAEQRLTIGALRSGFLSTFRLTLLALNDFDFLADRGEIDRFMDRLWIAVRPMASREAAETFEAAELNGEFHYPLNIQGNRRAELSNYLRFLKSRRRDYKRKYLSPSAAE